MRPSPPVDRRTREDVARRLQELLAERLPGWPDGEGGDVRRGPGTALTQVFAGFVEHLIDELNRAPDRTRHAFLSVLGDMTSLPRPARVPVTFRLTPGAGSASPVPERTPLAAGSAGSDGGPVTFETEHSLDVLDVEVTSLVIHEPAADRFARLGAGVPGEEAATPAGPPVFSGDTPVPHHFYIGHDELLERAEGGTLRLSIDVAPSTTTLRDRRVLAWEIWDGQAGIPLEPKRDGTANLLRSGEIVFEDVPSFPVTGLRSRQSRWLRCRLRTPVTPSRVERKGMVRAEQLPELRDVRLSVKTRRADLAPQSGFAGPAPVDLSRPYFPFGRRPEFGDVFYLASEEALSTPGATVSMDVELVNPAGGEETGSPPSVQASDDLRLSWEVWSGEEWSHLGTARPDRASREGGTGFEDTTRALTRSGRVTFRLPREMAVTTVHGAEGHWLRVRIASGDYGRPAGYDRRARAGEEEFTFRPGTVAPPAVERIEMACVVEEQARRPAALLSNNEFVWRDLTERVDRDILDVAPFQIGAARLPALYVGLARVSGEGPLPPRGLSLYADVDEAAPDQEADSRMRAAPWRVSWSYWSGSGWQRLAVRDGTDGFRTSGSIELLLPEELRESVEFGERRFWLRARLVDGALPGREGGPRLRRLLANTTIAVQAFTIRDELLGSSNGTPAQSFRVAHAPVLEDLRLEVREGPESSTGEGGRSDRWVAWQEVDDFHGSDPNDRHFVMDHVSGRIRFGDGNHGRIPPRGRGNLRMAHYRTGGGVSGNVAAGAITELKTTLPYIAEVANHFPAVGGADPESIRTTRERTARSLRHRGRAVAVEDYEDLALLASAQVARSLCVPLADLRPGSEPRTAPGHVSLVVVPHSTTRRPYPSRSLLRAVDAELSRRMPSDIRLHVTGPAYVAVAAGIELELDDPERAGEIEESVSAALDAFLHPLTGGSRGQGWPFGRLPHRSDLYPVVASVSGVERVVSLDIETREERPGLARAGWFLVHPAEHRIDVRWSREVNR